MARFESETSPVTEFEWTSDIAVGHAEIDEQHKRLILLGQAVAKSVTESVETKPGAIQLQALIDFTIEHFAFEENLMRSSGYPEAERHAKYHASLLMEFRTYCGKMHSDRNSDSVALITYLWSWLSLHIVSLDRELVQWLRTHEANAGG